MKVLETAKLTWDAAIELSKGRSGPLGNAIVPGQAADETQSGVVIVHGFESGGRSRLAKVNEFERSIGRPDKHETASADAAMVHGYARPSISRTIVRGEG